MDIDPVLPSHYWTQEPPLVRSYLYSGEINGFTEDELVLLEEMAEDLAFGVMALRDKGERQNVEEALKSSDEKYSNSFRSNRRLYLGHRSRNGPDIGCKSRSNHHVWLSKGRVYKNEIFWMISAEPEKTWNFICTRSNCSYHCETISKPKDGTCLPGGK